MYPKEKRNAARNCARASKVGKSEHAFTQVACWESPTILGSIPAVKFHKRDVGQDSRT